MLDSVRAARGVIRSLRIYYGGRQRRGALDRHYARFVAKGDLVFDIGSHVGDRVAAFRRLGARVIGQHWTRTVEVPVTTLDALIARHGVPRFIKIDVEGFEAEVLAGLSTPTPALSFEFTTIQRDVACACVARCAAIGYGAFEASLGESLAFVHGRKLDAGEITDWLMGLPERANSGDIYASLA